MGRCGFGMHVFGKARIIVFAQARLVIFNDFGEPLPEIRYPFRRSLSQIPQALLRGLGPQFGGFGRKIEIETIGIVAFCEGCEKLKDLFYFLPLRPHRFTIVDEDHLPELA